MPLRSHGAAIGRTVLHRPTLHRQSATPGRLRRLRALMRRAYRPRLSTVHLLADITARPGVASARIIAPHRGTTIRPAGVRITLDALSGDGRPVYTDFATLADARAWLATDIAESLRARPEVLAVTVLTVSEVRDAGGILLRVTLRPSAIGDLLPVPHGSGVWDFSLAEATHWLAEVATA